MISVTRWVLAASMIFLPIEAYRLRHGKRAVAVDDAAAGIDLAVEFQELLRRAELAHGKLDPRPLDRLNRQHRIGHEHEAQRGFAANEPVDVRRRLAAERAVQIVELIERHVAFGTADIDQAGQPGDLRHLLGVDAVVRHRIAVIVLDRELRRAELLGFGCRDQQDQKKGDARDHDGTLSISARAIDGIFERQAALETLDLRDDMRGEHRGEISPALCGVIVTLGWVHSGLSGGNGSCGKTSSVQPASVPSSSAVDDVGIDLQRAPPRVDEECAAGRAVALELAKQRKIQNTFGVARPRQQANQDFRPRQKGIEAGLPMKGLARRRGSWACGSSPRP